MGIDVYRHWKGQTDAEEKAHILHPILAWRAWRQRRYLADRAWTWTD